MDKKKIKTNRNRKLKTKGIGETCTSDNECESKCKNSNYENYSCFKGRCSCWGEQSEYFSFDTDKNGDAELMVHQDLLNLSTIEAGNFDNNPNDIEYKISPLLNFYFCENPKSIEEKKERKNKKLNEGKFKDFCYKGFDYNKHFITREECKNVISGIFDDSVRVPTKVDNNINEFCNKRYAPDRETNKEDKENCEIFLKEFKDEYMNDKVVVCPVQEQNKTNEYSKNTKIFCNQGDGKNCYLAEIYITKNIKRDENNNFKKRPSNHLFCSKNRGESCKYLGRDDVQ